MAHHTLQSLDGASPGIGGLHLPGGETEYEEKTLIQNMKLLTEMNFEVGFIKTKHS